MIFIPTRLYQGQLSTSQSTFYTVSSGQTVLLKQIIITNTTTSSANITISLVPSGEIAGNTNKIISSLNVNGNGVITVDLNQAMNQNDFLSGLQGTSGALTITISGVVIS